ncbi:MAG: hypothetical protein CL945_15640, partial [Dinoroseobacter sp.]|nr:hypothetical protein [Dinoroseobacter sp.]
NGNIPQKAIALIFAQRSAGRGYEIDLVRNRQAQRAPGFPQMPGGQRDQGWRAHDKTTFESPISGQIDGVMHILICSYVSQ